MRNITKFVVAGLAIATSISAAVKPAAATPATLGFYPATDIYGKGTMHLDFDSYGRGIKADGLVSSGLTYGIGPDTDKAFGRSEIGFDYLLSAAGGTPAIDTGKRFLFNAKTQLYNNDATGTRVVIGGWGLGNKQAGAPGIVYLTGSKTFEFGRVHLGVAQSLANKAIITAGPGEDDKTSISLGYDKMLTDKLQFAVDMYTGKNLYSGIQPTLYYYINDKANFGLGLMRFNSKNVGPSRNQVYVCFDYNFDFKAAK